MCGPESQILQKETNSQFKKIVGVYIEAQHVCTVKQLKPSTLTTCELSPFSTTILPSPLLIPKY
jgi:hypothetical protein